MFWRKPLPWDILRNSNELSHLILVTLKRDFASKLIVTFQRKVSFIKALLSKGHLNNYIR